MSGKKAFSLIELMAVMAVLAIIIVASFQFFSSAQSILSSTENTRGPAEDARIALDVISRDLENAYFGSGSAPFWHWRPPSDSSTFPSGWSQQFRNELIAFVSATPVPPNDSCTSRLCEIKYQLHYSTSHDSNEGWLERSVTGDRNSLGAFNNKWNFFNNLTVSYGTDTCAFTVNSNSSENYQKLIPNVIEFKADCFYALNAPITPANGTSIMQDLTATKFPFTVIITLTLLDQASWNKWITLQGVKVYPKEETDEARTLRLNKQQTFTRTIYIGDRGQE